MRQKSDDISKCMSYHVHRAGLLTTGVSKERDEFDSRMAMRGRAGTNLHVQELKPAALSQSTRKTIQAARLSNFFRSTSSLPHLAQAA